MFRPAGRCGRVPAGEADWDSAKPSGQHRLRHRGFHTRLSGSEGAREWGAVTVGHAFSPVVHLTNAVLNEVRVRGHFGFPSGTGQLAWVSELQEHDVALVRVPGSQLVTAGLILSAASAPSGPLPRSLDFLVSDAISGPFGGALGQSLRYSNGTGPGFRVDHYFPDLGPGVIQGVSTLRDTRRVVATEGPSDGVFPEGTSGSCWHVEGTPAAVQVAGTPDAWLTGYGQSLVTLVERVRLQLGRLSPPPISEFALVSTF